VPHPLTSRFPSPLTLLVGCVLVAAILSHLLPAGRFDRREDPGTGRSVVVAGTYHEVPPAPVGAFQAVVAIPRGMADAASVIFFVFLVGGGFAVVEKTGASTRLVHRMVGQLAGRGRLMIPIASVAFGLGGVLIQMQEELIAFVPMLLLLCRQLGFSPIIAASVSIGAAAVGAAFSPVNPFQVVIAQKVAELPPQSGMGFRLVFLVIAMGIWIWGTWRLAARSEGTAGDVAVTGTAVPEESHARDATIFALVLATFAFFIVGAQRWGWDFEQFSALFFLMGVAAGLVGFARGIYVVLDDGMIIDTIVHALFTPLASLPRAVSAAGMMGVQTLIHIPVPSTSGQAVLTMPVLVPLSDLLGLSRQVTVLAYQYGAGLCELLTPTNGALMAMLAATGVPYDQWLRFAGRMWLLLAGLGVAGILIGVAVGV
jgi:uncharacterized ion transporter superfamily protein YfcC